MRKLVTAPYETPAGFLDFPFVYVYDATGIQDGTAKIIGIQKSLQGDSDFILRNIVGVPTCVDTAANGGRFNFRNASGSYAIANQIVPADVMPVLPEKLYPHDASITFDLYQTLRSFNVCGATPIYNSFIGFVGVKRIPLGRGYAVRATPYQYREFRYSYEYQLTISQGHYSVFGQTGVTPPQRVVVPMDNFDFELLQISISANNAAGALQTNDFQLMLYDCNMHQLSDVPLNQGYLNAGNATATTAPQYQAIWPVPSLVYPAGGNLVVDITSMLCANAVPLTYNISFTGIWRKPC